MSLAAVNHIYAFHEAMNGCKKKSKDSLKAFFENVNIEIYSSCVTNIDDIIFLAFRLSGVVFGMLMGV